MSIFNNSDLNYNYDGNGADINNFEDSDYSITEKIDVRNCRGCNKEFEVGVAYDKNGSVVFFVSKYCNECNLKMDINNNVCVNSNDSTWGSDIAKIPQNSIEGLQESLTNLSLNIKHGSEKLNDLEKDFSSHKDTVEDKLYLVNNRITNVRVQVGENKAAQTYFNEDQIGINLAHFALIKEIHKTLFIGFSVLVVFMLATWGYLTYTFFKQ